MKKNNREKSELVLTINIVVALMFIAIGVLTGVLVQLIF